MIFKFQIFKDPNFLEDPREAISNAFEKAEKIFILDTNPTNLPTSGKNVKVELDRSGTCALIVLIIKDICYTANIGDSRALLSHQNSTKLMQVTKDHRPYQYDERIRLINSAAYIYT